LAYVRHALIEAGLVTKSRLVFRDRRAADLWRDARFPIPILDWTYKTALKERFVLKSSIEASLYGALPIEVRVVYDSFP
jgi:hypothetical protein